MRTIDDLPDDLAARADRLRRRLGLSRAELIRRALRLYLERAPEGEGVVSPERVFGLWRGRGVDGPAWQERLRSEWDHD